MRTRIKICGVRHVEDALTAARAGADAVGLVFVTRSPRLVMMEDAARISAALPAFVEPIALFVDGLFPQVRDTALQLGLRTVQLHGSESPAYAKELRPLKVIKALPFGPQLPDEAARWRTQCPNLAALLIDTPPAQAEALPGGGGAAFNWQELAQMQRPDWPPLLLAGGLNPHNVAQAIAQVRPWGVDVSSGVERQRGVKDPQLIQAFCAAVC